MPDGGPGLMANKTWQKSTFKRRGSKGRVFSNVYIFICALKGPGCPASSKRATCSTETVARRWTAAFSDALIMPTAGAWPRPKAWWGEELAGLDWLAGGEDIFFLTFKNFQRKNLTSKILVGFFFLKTAGKNLVEIPNHEICPPKVI